MSEHVAANSSVNVAAGQAWVPGTSTTLQGLYYARNAAVVNLAITASNPTNPRADKIVLRIRDSAYTGTEDLVELAVIAGTAEAGVKLEGGGKAPKGVAATPVSSLLLAYVLVPAASTSIVAADIENVVSIVRAATFGGGVNGPVGSSPSFLSWGVIGAAGAIEAGSGDFTVEHAGGTSAYRIVWKTAKSSATYAVLVSELKTPAAAMSYSARTTASFEAQTSAAEVPFSFVVVALS